MQESKTLHYILGAALVMIAVFALSAFLMVNSQADTATVTIVNSAPTTSLTIITASDAATTSDSTVSSFDSGAPLTLNAAGDRIILVQGKITDTNGFTDIASVQVGFYRTGAGVDGTGGPSARWAGDSYTATCLSTATGTYAWPTGSGNDRRFICPITVAFYAVSTGTGVLGTSFTADSWTVVATATDTAGPTAGATHSTGARHIASLTSLGFGSTTIRFGSMALNSVTNDDASVAEGSSGLGSKFQTFTQQGNARQRLTVGFTGTSMSCTIGTIDAASRIKWNTAVNQGFANVASTNTAISTGTTTATAPIDVPAMVLANGTSPTTSKLYWNISIPASGVGGSCTGVITEAAVIT